MFTASFHARSSWNQKKMCYFALKKKRRILSLMKTEGPYQKLIKEFVKDAMAI